MAHPPLDLAGLFREHSRGLAGAVRGVLGARADVQEVLQEAFLKAWRALDGGSQPVDPTAWVFVLTMNLARDQLRRERRRGPHHELNEVDEVRLQAREPEPAQRIEGREAVAAARNAIHTLADAEKEVFLLRASGDLSFAAVADALGIPVGTAKSRMRAALRNLRDRLADHAPDAHPLRLTADAEIEGDAR